MLEEGWELLYLLHLTPPYGKRRVGHYLGRTSLTIDERLRYHRGSRGAKLIRAQLDVGGDFVLAFAMQVPIVENIEGVLKRRHMSWRNICPVCLGWWTEEDAAACVV